MSESYPTTLERRKASSLARGLAVDAAKALRVDAQRAIDETVRGLGKLYECGVSRDHMTDMAKGLHDIASDLEAAILAQLDGSDPQWEGLDFVDLRDLLAQIKG